MENGEMYKARRPLEWVQLLCISVLTGSSIYSTYHRFVDLYSGDRILLLSVGVAICIGCLMIEGILFYRVFTYRGTIDIEIKPEEIQIKDYSINAKAIEMVYIKGYFRPVIGFKPKRQWFVPYRSCFSFYKNEDQGMKALKAWADQNQIQVAYKSFKRWL